MTTLAPAVLRMATTKHEVYDDEVSLEIKDGIALVTFIATEGQFPWKTKRWVR